MKFILWFAVFVTFNVIWTCVRAAKYGGFEELHKASEAINPVYHILAFAINWGFFFWAYASYIK